MDGDTHAKLKAMEATTTTSAVDEAGAFSAFSASKRSVRSLKLKEKEQQQIDFIESCTIADALVDEAKPITLKGCKDTTPLRSIKGVCISLLGVKVLRSFMIKNKIQYKNKTKGEMCALIVERKKNEHLDQIMYSEDFEGDKSHDDSDEGEEEDVTADVTGVKKLKRLSKGSKPRELSEDGSLYRLILVYFLQELRPYVNQLGTNPLAVQLSEVVETKESIEQYKRASEDALRDLQNTTAPVDEEATVPSRIGTEEKSNGTPENSTLGDDDDQSYAGAGSASATV
jgi:hypothetical protein